MSPLDAIVEQLADAVADAVADRIVSRQPAAASQPEPYLNVDDAAAFLGNAPASRIYDLVQRGDLKPCRDGRRLLFSHAELRRYLEGR
jgi:excisionase family DNA binding protein